MHPANHLQNRIQHRWMYLIHAERAKSEAFCRAGFGDVCPEPRWLIVRHPRVQLPQTLPRPRAPLMSVLQQRMTQMNVGVLIAFDVCRVSRRRRLPVSRIVLRHRLRSEKQGPNFGLGWAALPVEMDCDDVESVKWRRRPQHQILWWTLFGPGIPGRNDVNCHFECLRVGRPEIGRPGTGRLRFADRNFCFQETVIGFLRPPHPEARIEAARLGRRTTSPHRSPPATADHGPVLLPTAANLHLNYLSDRSHCPQKRHNVSEDVAIPESLPLAPAGLR